MRVQNQRGGRPASSQSGYAGTTSCSKQARTLARKASCSPVNTVRRIVVMITNVHVECGSIAPGALERRTQTRGRVGIREEPYLGIPLALELLVERRRAG